VSWTCSSCSKVPEPYFLQAGLCHSNRTVLAGRHLTMHGVTLASQTELGAHALPGTLRHFDCSACIAIVVQQGDLLRCRLTNRTRLGRPHRHAPRPPGPGSIARPHMPPAMLVATTLHGLPKTTPSLQLRHFTPDDALELMALNAEPSTSRWLSSHVYATTDEARSRLGYLIACYNDPGHPQLGPYVLAVTECGTSRLLGHVGFSPLDNEVEVSYAIAESARGRGYGAKSLIHACAWAAASFGLSRIWALTASANVASRRTLERASFGHDRDAEQVFQGVRQAVSRYCWHAAGAGS